MKPGELIEVIGTCSNVYFPETSFIQYTVSECDHELGIFLRFEKFPFTDDFFSRGDYAVVLLSRGLGSITVGNIRNVA